MASTHTLPEEEGWEFEPVLDSRTSDDEMLPNRPTIHRPVDGRPHQPLLQDERRRLSNTDFGHGNAEHRPMLHHSRRPTIRSPEYSAELATRQKYMIASGFLLLSLASFVVQTETAVYIQHELHWDKPYCML